MPGGPGLRVPVAWPVEPAVAGDSPAPRPVPRAFRCASRSAQWSQGPDEAAGAVPAVLYSCNQTPGWDLLLFEGRFQPSYCLLTLNAQTNPFFDLSFHSPTLRSLLSPSAMLVNFVNHLSSALHTPQRAFPVNCPQGLVCCDPVCDPPHTALWFAVARVLLGSPPTHLSP